MDWLTNKAKGASNLYVDKICAKRISEAVQDALKNPMNVAQRYGLSRSFLPFRIKTRSHYKKRSNLRKGSRKGSRKSKSRKVSRKYRSRKGSRKSKKSKSRGKRKLRSRKSRSRK